MLVVDADSHIMEPEAMFANLEPDFHPRRPIATFLPPDTPWGESNGVWLLEGKVLPNIGGAGGRTTFYLPGSLRSRRVTATIGEQTLEDLDARCAAMDAYGITEQIVYPTMFLVSAVEDVKLEAALFRAYNNYVSAACARAGGRLKWIALVPFRDPGAAVAEVRRASELGAAGIFTLGVVYDRHLSDPDFFPIYDAMSELDLPLCVHSGWGAPKVNELFPDNNAFFCSGTTPVIWGFYYVISSALLARFPKLRVGFVETGAEWVPYTNNQLRRKLALANPVGRRAAAADGTGGGGPSFDRDPATWFRDGRAFVTCQADENLPYLLGELGEDALMVSSDYPHGDPSADWSFVDLIRARTDIGERVQEKLLGANAARFYRR